VFRAILADMRERQGKGVEVDVVCIGTEGGDVLPPPQGRHDRFIPLGEKPHPRPADRSVTGCWTLTAAGDPGSRLHLLKRFVNTSYDAGRRVHQLLPPPPSET
jgi:hypothetical protein